MSVLDRKELEQSPLADLHAIASELGVEGFRRMRKEELIGAILKDQPEDGDEPPERDRAAEAEAVVEEREAEEEEEEAEAEAEAEPEPEPEPEEEDVRTGVLDILPNGSGFMRSDPFSHSRDDVYVSPAQIRRCELRAGDEISGPVRPPRRSERYPSLVRIDAVNGQEPEPPADRPRFEDLTAVFATERLPSPDGLDAPFGKGSRVAIAGPPGAGATSLLRRIVSSLGGGELEPVVVLAGVRPEEVTEWRRESGITVAGGAFDGSQEEQAQVAEMAVERAKRAVEQGRDAVVVVDSLDALPSAVARRVFGAARKVEEGGSLTVIAAVGESAEPLRVATTRIVLDGGTTSASSGTTRADLLS
ncbi:MAG TPA: Rho termination factor N-terminal domain-containing protein [Thermoleophilaceae bacterium]